MLAVYVGEFFYRGEIVMRKGKMYVALAAAVVLTISGGVTLRAADTVLDTVYVNADRDGEVVAAPGGLVNETAKLGILGN